MAEAAVTLLLEQLKEVALGYKDLISGAEKEFKKLNDDLDLLKAFLMETAEKKKKDKLLKVLERRIRDVVCEVEETIDTCLTSAMTSRRPAFLRTSLAKQIKAIRKDKLQPLFVDANNFVNMQKIAAEASAGDEYSSTPPTTRVA